MAPFGKALVVSALLTSCASPSYTYKQITILSLLDAEETLIEKLQIERADSTIRARIGGDEIISQAEERLTEALETLKEGNLALKKAMGDKDE